MRGFIVIPASAADASKGDYPFRAIKNGLTIDINARRGARVQKQARRLMRKVAKAIPGGERKPAFAWAGTFAETQHGLPFSGAPAARFARAARDDLWRQWHHLQHAWCRFEPRLDRAPQTSAGGAVFV